MIFIVVVAVVGLVLVAWFSPSMFDVRSGAALDESVLASQMIYHHTAASKACADGLCPEGPVTDASVVKEMSSFRQEIDGRMRSVSLAMADPDGVRGQIRVVATTIGDTTVYDAASMGELTAVLGRTARLNGARIGRFDRSVGEVLVLGEGAWADGMAATTSNCTSLPSGGRTCRMETELTVPVRGASVGSFAGVPDGAPVIVTRF